jgi:ribosomal protein L24
VISGKDKVNCQSGQGFPKDNLIIVEGVNMKKSMNELARQIPRQIIEGYAIHVSNVMIVEGKGCSYW